MCGQILETDVQNSTTSQSFLPPQSPTNTFIWIWPYRQHVALWMNGVFPIPGFLLRCSVFFCCTKSNLWMCLSHLLKCCLHVKLWAIVWNRIFSSTTSHYSSQLRITKTQRQRSPESVRGNSCPWSVFLLCFAHSLQSVINTSSMKTQLRPILRAMWS